VGLILGSKDHTTGKCTSTYLVIDIHYGATIWRCPRAVIFNRLWHYLFTALLTY